MDIVELVRSKIEPSEPANTILAYFKEHAGKKYTTRVIDQLRERCKDPSIQEDRIAGMSSITWGGYRQSGGERGGSILFSRVDTGRVIDPVALEKENPAHFEARDRRNKQREEFLASDLDIDRADRLFRRHAEIRKQLAEVETQINEMIDAPDGILAPDRYAIQEQLMGKRR